MKRTKLVLVEESGAILVLAAGTVGVFIIMAALAIDLALDITSREQAKNFARLSALAAIEAYFESDSEEFADRIAAARAAADKVSGATENESAPGNFVIGSSERAESLQDADDSSLFYSGFKEGIYYFTEAEAGVNPCANPSEDEPPCFVPLAAGAGVEDQKRVNAFKIEGAMYTSLTTRFAKAFGVTTLLPATVSAISTVVPRHGCFMVDLSPSMAGLTHDYGTTRESREFGFEWDTATDQPAILNFSEKWENMLPVRPAGDSNPKNHYQNDYQLFTPFADGAAVLYPELHPSPEDSDVVPLSSNDISRPYKVDMFRGPTYHGPEPLMTVMKGLRAAVQAFKERRVAGDEICIIFYDNRLAWSRTIRLTDEFNKVYEFLDFDFETEYDPTGSNPPPAGLRRMIEHGLFPTYVDGGSYTNMLAAVSEATRQFEQAAQSGIPASNFLVFIGDGLSNCGTCINFVGSPADVNGDSRINGEDSNIVTGCANTSTTPPVIENQGVTIDCLPKADLNGDGRLTSSDQTLWQQLFDEELSKGVCSARCEHKYPTYKQAITQLKGFAKTQLAPNNTPAHVVLVGDHVAPHSIDLDNGSGGCMSDNETRVSNLPYTQGGNSDGQAYANETAWSEAFDSMGPLADGAVPFYEVNADLYEVASSTGGIWAPIRTQASSCSETEEKACDPTQRRRTTDPFCRSMERQITKYMEVIIGQNPYTLTSDD